MLFESGYVNDSNDKLNLSFGPRPVSHHYRGPKRHGPQKTTGRVGTFAKELVDAGRTKGVAMEDGVVSGGGCVEGAIASFIEKKHRFGVQDATAAMLPRTKLSTGDCRVGLSGFAPSASAFEMPAQCQSEAIIMLEACFVATAPTKVGKSFLAL